MEDKDIYKIIDKIIQNELEDEVDINEEDLFNGNINIDDKYKLEDKSKEKLKENIKNSIKNTKNSKALRGNKLIISASIICALIISPIVVKAIVDKVYNYVDTTSQIIKSDALVYKLKSPIIKDINDNKITLESFVINTKDNSISMRMKGTGSRPTKDNTTISIGDNNIDTSSCDIGYSGNEWVYGVGSKYDGDYSNEDIKVIIEFGDKTSSKFEFSLIKSDSVSSYKELGPSDNKNGIEIVAVTKEENNILDVNFISPIQEKQIQIIDYGNPYNYNEKTDTYENNIILKDKNGKEVKGKIVQHGDRANNFTFDTTNMEKPYKIVIPQIIVSSYGEIPVSKKIKIPIPKDGESIDFNKEVFINNNKEYGFKCENNSFKITKIKRTNDDITMYINFNKNNEIVKRRDIDLATDRDIISGTILYSGYSRGIIDDNNEGIIGEITLAPRRIDKSNIKIRFNDGEFIVYGPWEIEVR